MAYEVTVKNDGKDLPLNDYVEQVVAKVIAAVLEDLKGIDMNKETVITLRKK